MRTWCSPTNSRSYAVDAPEAFHKLEARYVKDDRLRIRCPVCIEWSQIQPGPKMANKKAN